LNDKNYYIQAFKSLLKPYQFTKVDKVWYKPKFEWRIEFNFSRQDSIGRHSIDNRWQTLLRECELNLWEFRRRREAWCNIYTSEIDLLEHLLTNEKYRTAIVSVEYTNEQYMNELDNQINLDSITDIKFVKHVPEYRYQVFLGGFEWGNDSVKRPLTEYLVTNRDEFLFKGYYQEIIHRCKNNNLVDNFGRYSGVYDGFNFYAKSTDDILMLHMIAPSKIKKIVKLMERVK